MKIGPNQRTPEEIKDQLVQAHRAYREGKEQIFEKSVTYAESGKSWILAPLFIGLLILIWLYVVLWAPSLSKMYKQASIFPAVIAFYTAYYAFFHSTKLIFKPSKEELTDDTSYFALFSACEPRERRGLSSAAFAATNTFACIVVLIAKQTGPDAWSLY
jgi:hypothetical protein